MKIKVEVKSVYGVDRIYPVCGLSELFLALKGGKTFSKHDIETIKALGFEVEVVTPSL